MSLLDPLITEYSMLVDAALAALATFLDSLRSISTQVIGPTLQYAQFKP
jgi:hypothetical protein